MAITIGWMGYNAITKDVEEILIHLDPDYRQQFPTVLRIVVIALDGREHKLSTVRADYKDMPCEVLPSGIKLIASQDIIVDVLLRLGTPTICPRNYPDTDILFTTKDWVFYTHPETEMIHYHLKSQI